MLKRPLFSTINSIIFPGSPSMFMIKRDFSIGSVKEAMKNHNGELIITSQKEMSVKKAGLNDMYTIGCLCKIDNEIELPDGTIKFAVTALDRIRIKDVIDEKDVRFATGELIERPSKKKTIPLPRKEKLVSKLKSLKPDMEDDDISSLIHFNPDVEDYEFVMTFSHFLKHDQIKHRELTLDEINTGTMLLDVLTEEEKQKVNLGMAKMQELLESNDFETSVQKMEKMLGV